MLVKARPRHRPLAGALGTAEISAPTGRRPSTRGSATSAAPRTGFARLAVLAPLERRSSRYTRALFGSDPTDLEESARTFL